MATATATGLNNMAPLASQLPAASTGTATPSSISSAPLSSPAFSSTQSAPPGVVPVATLTTQPATHTTNTTSGSTTQSTNNNSQQAHNLVHQRNGEQIYNSMEKIVRYHTSTARNSELLSMTYGAMVTQLIKDYKDVKVVNTELEKMGYNIGVRLVDEFLAKSNLQSCVNFRETAQVIAKVGFKMFLGITAEVVRWREDGRQCSLVFKQNPLAEFVELPGELYELDYNILICGAIRGSLHMLQMNVECQLIKDEVKGQNESEIRLTLKEILVENYNDEEEH